MQHAHLGAKEIEVLRLTVKGKSTKEIGEAMSIGARTVEAHRAHMYKKIGEVYLKAGIADIRTGLAMLTRYALAMGIETFDAREKPD